jgi:hypothetical protein
MDTLTLASQGEEILGVVTIGGGLFVAVIAIVVSAIKSTLKTRQIEQSRREIAAYIAEGSMTPEQGERLMRAGPSRDA